MIDLFLGIVLGGLIIMFILNPHKYIILLSEKDKDIESLKNEAEKLYKLNKELVDGVQKINQQSISNIQYYISLILATNSVDFYRPNRQYLYFYRIHTG